MNQDFSVRRYLTGTALTEQEAREHMAARTRIGLALAPIRLGARAGKRGR